MSEFIDFRQAATEIIASDLGKNLYFLVDHSGLPGLLNKFQHSFFEWTSIFDHTKEENALTVAPILILAASNGQLRLSRPFLSWLGKYGTYSSTVMMLVSPLDIESLSNQLAARLDTRLAEGIEAMLRFFDPRIFESLLNILSAEQRQEFLEAAILWCYVNRAGKIIRVATDFCERHGYPDALILSQQQESDLIDASETDQVINLLQSSISERISSIPSEERYDLFVKMTSDGRKKGLDSVLQLSLYSMIELMCLKERIGYETHEEIIMKLKSNDFDGLKILLAEYFS